MQMRYKEAILYVLWLFLYILCVGLGTVEKVEGLGKVFFILTALIFFIPGVMLLSMGIRENNKKTVLRVRIIAVCSLLLTVAVFCVNLWAVGASAGVGRFLHDLLNLVSAPMFCMQYWIVSLFLWACILSASFLKRKR